MCGFNRQKGKDRNIRGRALLCQGESRGRSERKARREVWDGLKEAGSRAAESQDKSPHYFVCMSVLSGYVWSRRKTEFITQLRNLSKISQTCAISLHLSFWRCLLRKLEPRRTIWKGKVCFSCVPGRISFFCQIWKWEYWKWVSFTSPV